jgi:hypothetical protein
LFSSQKLSRCKNPNRCVITCSHQK